LGTTDLHHAEQNLSSLQNMMTPTKTPLSKQKLAVLKIETAIANFSQSFSENFLPLHFYIQTLVNSRYCFECCCYIFVPWIVLCIKDGDGYVTIPNVSIASTIAQTDESIQRIALFTNRRKDCCMFQ